MFVNPLSLAMVLGALHGLVLVVLLAFSRRGERAANWLLAAMVLCFTLPLLKVTLHEIGFFAAYGIGPWSIELLYGLGPSLFLYVAVLTRPEPQRLRRRDGLHFLPVALEAVYYLSPLYGPHAQELFWPPHSLLHGVWMGQQLGGVVSLLIYLVLVNLRLLRYRRWVRENYSSTRKRNLRWLSTPTILYSSFVALWLGLRGLDVVVLSGSLTSAHYLPLLVFLAASTYWVGTAGYLKRTESVAALPEQPRESPGVQDQDDADRLAQLFDQLEHTMRRDRPYLNSELTLAELAESLGVNPRLLSRTINRMARANFYDYVNGFRLVEARRHLRASDRVRILDVAFESGFGSKATLNSAFKKKVGVTPSQYRKAWSSENGGAEVKA